MVSVEHNTLVLAMCN